jgi:hypothetical protein
VDNKPGHQRAAERPAEGSASPSCTVTPVERRTGVDRRKANEGAPPGSRERRVNLEPRKPDVEEVTLSASDWMRFDAAVPFATKAPDDASR